MANTKDLPVYPAAVVQWICDRNYRIPQDVLSWIRTNGPGREPVDQGLPWLNFPLIALLERRLRAGGCRVFEWGAGGSTVFYARRAAAVVTVEHDARWCERVRPAIRGAARETVDLRHVPPDPAPAAGPLTEPLMAVPPLRRAKWDRFRSYITQVREAGGPFDIVQVDGRARLECAAVAREHLAPGGWLVVDDVDKPGRYRDLRRLLPVEEWVVVRTVGPGPASGRRLVTSAVVARRR